MIVAALRDIRQCHHSDMTLDDVLDLLADDVPNFDFDDPDLMVIVSNAVGSVFGDVFQLE